MSEGPEVTADVTVFNSSTQGLNVAAVLKHPDHSHWTNEPVTLLPIGKTAVFEAIGDGIVDLDGTITFTADGRRGEIKLFFKASVGNVTMNATLSGTIEGLDFQSRRDHMSFSIHTEGNKASASFRLVDV